MITHAWIGHCRSSQHWGSNRRHGGVGIFIKNVLYSVFDISIADHEYDGVGKMNDVITCIDDIPIRESIGIRNRDIFIFNTTKAFGQVNSTCLQKKTYSIFQVSKQYVTIIRSKKTKQNKIYLIGSCINRRNTQQNYVNSLMTNGNKPVIRHINAPVHNIKGGLFDNMYHLWHRFSEQINLANVHSPQIWIIYYLKLDC